MELLECTLGILAFLLFCATAVLGSVLNIWTMLSTPNPFAKDSRRPKKPLVKDRKRRDAVLKRQFDISKVKHI